MAKIQQNIENVLRKYLSGATLSGVEQTALKEAARENPEIAAVIRSSPRRRGYGQSAQRLGVPGVGNLRERNAGGYGSGRTISPGGFKKSGLDEASYARMGGDLTPQAITNNVVETMRQVPIDKRGKLEAGNLKYVKDGGVTFNGRTYSPREVDWIMRRARTGATLSTAQQAIYDASVRRDREAAAEEVAQKQQQMDWRMKMDEAKLKSQLRQQEQAEGIRLRAEATARQKEADRKAVAAEKKARDDAEAEAFNKRHKLPEGTRLSAEERKAFIDGKLTYGLSPADKKRKEALEAELDRIVSDPSTSPADAEAVAEQISAIEAGFRSRIREKTDDEKSVGDRFKERVTPWTDPETGKVRYFLENLKGEFTPIAPDKSADAAAVRESARSNRRADFITQENLRRQKAWETAQDKAEKDWNNATDEYGERVNKPGSFVRKPYDFAANRKLIADEFDANNPVLNQGGVHAADDVPPADPLAGPEQTCEVCGDPLVNGVCVNPNCYANPNNASGADDGGGAYDPYSEYGIIDVQ